MVEERILKFLLQWMADEKYPPEAVEAFKDRWHRLRAQDRLPCPVCFTNEVGESREQPLAPLPAGGGVEPLLCPHCKTRFDLPEPA